MNEAIEVVALPIGLLEYHLGRLQQAFAASHPENDPYLLPWKVTKDAVYLTVLVAAYLQYYFIDVMVEIASLPALSAHV